MTDKPRVEPSVSEPARCECGKEIELCAYAMSEPTCSGWVHRDGGHYCVGYNGDATDKVRLHELRLAADKLAVAEAQTLTLRAELQRAQKQYAVETVEWATRYDQSVQFLQARCSEYLQQAEELRSRLQEAENRK